MITEETENLFSYGTLQDEAVQLSIFGRGLEGQPDNLIGYRVTMIPIRDQSVEEANGATHYRNVEFTGSDSHVVAGTVFKVTALELAKADVYEEVANYKRILVELDSGTKAWVYLYSQPGSTIHEITPIITK